MSKDEVRLDLAVMFYASGRLSFGEARQLAGVGHLQFRHELAARAVTVHLEPHDIDSDLAAIEAALQA